MTMYKDLLPIGSVVLLKGGEKRLMICGRVVCREDGEQIYDYAGCYYPQGVLNTSQLFFFNHDAIETLFFIGFQDQEEMGYRSQVLGRLDGAKLRVEDGQILVEENKEN